VALISSGESGFYGMAGLLLELLQKIKKEYRLILKYIQVLVVFN